MATITVIQARIKQLDPAGFQRLCDDYLSRIGYPDLVSLGTMAGTQRTTRGTPDTYFCVKDGNYIFAEYTVQESGLVNKIRDDLNKCLNEEQTHVPISQISEIIYCHTSSNISPGDDRALKELCSNHGVLLTLIGIDKLADDIFWRYKTLSREHLGLTIDTEQIQTADDFVKQYDSNSLAAPLKTNFWGRDKELTAISQAFLETDVVIISGASGVGKTRLSIEFAKKHALENEELLYCIHNRALSLYDDLCMYFEQPGKYFVVVDDANQISNLNLIIDMVNKKLARFEVRVLITVRDYAMEKVTNSLDGCVQYAVVNIKRFKDDEIKELIKEQFDIRNAHYLDRIATISEGNARIAMLAGRVAVDTNRLDSILDASGLYDAYYGSVLNEIELNKDTALIATAGVAAFVGTLHLDHIDAIMPVLALNGVERDTFIECLSTLSDMEVVDIYHDKAVKFSEQCFANYILKYVFCDKKIVSLAEMLKVCFFQHRNRTMFAVNTLLEVFNSFVIREFVRSEIKAVWDQLKESDQQRFWIFIRSFYPVNPVEVLSMLNRIVTETEPVIIPIDQLDTEKGKNYQSVEDDIISILCGYTELEDFDSALDLFFQYYLKRPDIYIQFYHAATSTLSIQPSSSDLGYRTQIHFFRKLIEYADSWDNDYILILFLDIAKEFLQFEFSPYTSSRHGKGITIYHIPLYASEGAVAYRTIIWEQLLLIAEKGKQPERLRTVFKNYGRIIEDCSSALVQSDAPLICDIIQAAFSPDSIEDCLLAERISSCFERHQVPTNRIDVFLNSPGINAYRVLMGPDYNSDFDVEQRQSQHTQWIKKYFCTSDSQRDAFRRLFDTYRAIEEPDYRAGEGLNMALEELSDDKEAYTDTIRYILSCGSCNGINCNSVIQTLLSHIPAHEVYRLIQENSCDIVSTNCWLYAYYHELPEEQIGENQLTGLYDFLKDESDALIRQCPYRDILFLEKYQSLDSGIFAKASQIILDKRSYSPYIVISYFGLLFNPHANDEIDLIAAFHGHLAVLEEMYFFLLNHRSNMDHEGLFLLLLAKADKSLPLRLAEELLQEQKTHTLNYEGARFRALYALEDYIDVIDLIVDRVFKIADYPEFRAPSILKQFLVEPNDNSEWTDRETEWLQHFITNNAFDRIRMRCLFDAFPEQSLHLRKQCIEWFVRINQNYEDFTSLALLPTSYSAAGSFVPVYKKWIEYLNGLLPALRGITFIEHKEYILKRIDLVREAIVKEEIDNIMSD